MPIYLLPTRSPRRYRGKRPLHIRSVGRAMRPRPDGTVGWGTHIELYDGRRFFLTGLYCFWPHEQGWHIDMEFVLADATPLHPTITLSQDDYGAWLALVRHYAGLCVVCGASRCDCPSTFPEDLGLDAKSSLI